MNIKYYWHLVAWFLYLLYKFVDSHLDDGIQFTGAILDVTYFVTGLATFYLFYSVVWKSYSSAGRKLRLLYSIPLGLAFFIILRYGIEEVFLREVFGFGNYGVNCPVLFYVQDNLFRGSFFGMVSLMVVLMETKTDSEQRILQLKNEKADAEIIFLRSQLNPHFLFNTLSFLHTKAIQYDTALGETIRQLSEMFRYALQSSKSDRLPIEREVDLLENYISIFQKRFGSNFYVEFQVNGVNLGKMIEPLLLMPMVENAFKHGVTTEPDDPVRISLQVSDQYLNFKCGNRINNYQKDKGHGVGMENIKRRLGLLYPDKHSLNIEQDKEFYSVSLELELD